MKELTNTTTFRVRFSEVDSLRIVWHGHYLKYFEDGRDAWGAEFGRDFLEIYE
jgi:acyl-CoA thioester hydrolase